MRARYIKPGFFQNDILAECEPLARILFSGLWGYADKEGRFEWRPKKIKAVILPYDECNVNGLLEQLEQKGFVFQYSINGNTYGCIPHFLEHQNPHPHEARSRIPPPDDEIFQKYQCHEMSLHLHDMSCNSNHSYSYSYNNNEEDKLPNVPHAKIIKLWHEILPELPNIKQWTSTRQALLRSRWKENPERQDVDWWKGFFEYIRGCPFLMGAVDPKPGHKRFFARLDWVLKESNFLKILEGVYE